MSPSPCEPESVDQREALLRNAADTALFLRRIIDGVTADFTDIYRAGSQVTAALYRCGSLLVQVVMNLLHRQGVAERNFRQFIAFILRFFEIGRVHLLEFEALAFDGF